MRAGPSSSQASGTQTSISKSENRSKEPRPREPVYRTPRTSGCCRAIASKAERDGNKRTWAETELMLFSYAKQPKRAARRRAPAAGAAETQSISTSITLRARELHDHRFAAAGDHSSSVLVGPDCIQ